MDLSKKVVPEKCNFVVCTYFTKYIPKYSLKKTNMISFYELPAFFGNVRLIFSGLRDSAFQIPFRFYCQHSRFIADVLLKAGSCSFCLGGDGHPDGI